MPNVQPCALQRAYLQLRSTGREEDIDHLAAVVADVTVSTRVAARQIATTFNVNVSHNVITHHRGGTCFTCAKVVADAEAEAAEATAKAEQKAARKGKTNTKVFNPTPDGMVIPTSKDAPPPPPPPQFKSRMQYNDDGTVFVKDVPLYTPLAIDDDLSPLLIQFGLNPDKYEVLRDTFSMWMQSASDGMGGRDVTYLYSAKFRRVAQVLPGKTNSESLRDWHKVLLKSSKPTKPRFKKSAGTPGTYTLWPSDLQLGKPGTAEAVHNFTTGIEQGLEECQRLMDTGVPIEGLHLGWGGDETEGIANSYANQSHLIELNLSEQLELDTDLRIWAIERALELGLPVSTSHVVSNHGESFTRNGSKDPVTTKYDNASTHIARQVKRVFDKAGHDHLTWHIANDEAAVIMDLSGEKVYSSHGHIEKGRGASTELRTKNAIEKQILGDVGSAQRLLNIRLYVMAHYHHHYLIEDQGRTIMGLPALEAAGSSGYLLEAAGVWSPPGLLGMVVGRFHNRPYRHLTIFGAETETGLIAPAHVKDQLPKAA